MSDDILSTCTLLVKLTFVYIFLRLYYKLGRYVQTSYFEAGSNDYYAGNWNVRLITYSSAYIK